ncbi:NAD(P)/FAD-dependent oxidoreductase [Streptomyces violascens]|uniref:NAD(P)/FAD-dependent oxidoreductase n=1 Tax=Streptomyces violascens TaxID=67381 RepID=UPI0036679904
MTARVVVAGASLGGLRAAEQLRAAGWTGPITVVGDEPHMPYNRPPLSKRVLAGTAPFASLALTPRANTADVEWRLGTRVTGARLRDRVVVLDDGEELGFDGLVVATGLRARRLRCPGPSGPGSGRHTVRTPADIRALRDELALPGVRLVVTGAGFIGCEVAATAVGLGVAEVTVVDVEPLPMLRPLGEFLARALLRRHEERGVRFALGTGVAGFEGDDRVTGVVLSDGRVLPADVVVESVGSVANTEWLAGNGLDLSDGVLTDEHLRVRRVADGAATTAVRAFRVGSEAGGRAFGMASEAGGSACDAAAEAGAPPYGTTADAGCLPYVVAVGDIARFPNARYDGVPRRVEHWSIPGDTAKHAAKVLTAHLCSQPADFAPFAPLPSFWSDQYDFRLQSFGSPELGHDDVRLLDGEADGDMLVGYHRDGRLVGVVGLGGPAAAAAAARHRSLLLERPALSPQGAAS